MHRIHLRSVDLNLLTILHTLLEERSVTRAAASLHLTQSATSHALARLRDMFDDPLLERRGATMELTSYAETLREPLEQIISSLRNFLTPNDLPLAEIKQTIHIALADYPAAIFLPPIIHSLQQTAPEINIVVHSWRDAKAEIERLQRGDISLALSTFNELPQSIKQIRLGDETYVGVCRQNHPIGQTPSLEEWVSYPQVMVSSIGARSSPLDAHLETLGLRRRVALSVAGFLAVPAVIAASDNIALIPTSLARHWPAAKALRQFNVPFESGNFSVGMAWHIRRNKDVAIQALVQLFVEAAKNLLQQEQKN